MIVDVMQRKRNMFHTNDFRFLTISPDPEDFIELQSQISGHAVSPGVSISIEHLNMKDPSLARKCRVEEWSGIIPILTPDTIYSGVLSEIIHRALRHQIENEGFFVVPWLKGLNLQQLRQLAQNGNGLAADILENIHIIDKLTMCSGVTDALYQCCKNAKGMVLSSLCERVKRKITYMIGRLAAVILFSGGAFVYIVAFFMSPHIDGPAALEQLIPLLPTEEMRCMALALLTAFLIYFFQLFQVKIRGAEFEQLYPQMKFEFLPVLFMGIGCAFLIQQYGFGIPVKIIVIAVGAGIAIMSAFRAGCRAKLTPFSFSVIPVSLSEKTLLGKLYARMATSIAHTGSPFIRPMVNRAFISYSPASKWCSDTADRIYNILRDKGSKVFLDRKGLLPGQSWKSQLERSLKHTNVFIIILDEVSSLREWVISEFSYAYLSKMLIRSPEIFIIHPRGMDFTQLNTAHPHAWFFSEIVVRPSVNIPYWMRMKMAEFDDESVDAMCTKIRHWGGGIVNIWGLIIFALRSITLIPLEIFFLFLSAVGPFLLILPFFVTEIGGKKISDYMMCAAHPKIVFFAGLLSTSLVGCCASLSLAQLFGFKSTNQYGIGIRWRWIWNFFGMIGFGIVAWFMSHCFGWQDHALQFLTAYFGFAIGGIIIEESDFFDDTPPPKLGR